MIYWDGSSDNYSEKRAEAAKSLKRDGYVETSCGVWEDPKRPWRSTQYMDDSGEIYSSM